MIFGTSRGPDHVELARSAESRFGKRKASTRPPCKVEGVGHVNPETDQGCVGDLVIAFKDWSSALKSRAMRDGSGVAGVCVGCGKASLIGPDRRVVSW
ncbi:hypothetical protein KKE45_00210 [Patescibacteria group bacterium]|nr:hypothetical protein [Patescibacteria group bacterium]